MSRLFLFFSVVLIGLGFLSCERKAQSFIKSEKEIRTIEIPIRFDDSQYEPIREMNSEDRIAFLYYDPTGRIHLWVDGRDVVINEDVVKEHPRAIYGRLSYLYDGKYLYVSYWIKEANDKQVVFTRYDLKDGKILTRYFSTTKQALSPAHMATDGKGRLLLAWYDEHLVGYSIAYLVLENYGEKVPEKEEFIHFQGQTLYEKFMPAYAEGAGFYIIYAMSGGKDFIKSYLVDRMEDRTLLERDNRTIYHLYSFPKNSYIVTGWYDPAVGGNIEVFKIEGPDKLRKLASYSPEEVKKYYYGTNYYPFAFKDGYGSLFHRSQTEPIKLEGFPVSSRANIFLSEKGKGVPLTDDVPEYFFTQQVQSVYSTDGATFLVYSDNRYIFPSLMVAYITKDGKVYKNGLINKPSENLGVPKIVHIKEDLYRIFFQNFDRDKNRWNMKVVDVLGSKISKNHSLPRSRDMEKTLKEATENFSRCQIKDDVECIYKYFDPRYKTFVSLERQKEMNRQLNLKVKEFKYDSVKLIENTPLAVAKGEMTVQLPEQIMGKPIQQAGERKYKFTHIWLYINGSWYYAVEAPVGDFFIRW